MIDLGAFDLGTSDLVALKLNREYVDCWSYSKRRNFKIGEVKSPFSYNGRPAFLSLLKSAKTKAWEILGQDSAVYSSVFTI